MPAAYRLQLRALCCWALGGKPGGERPLLATSRRLPLSRAYREHQRRGTTPLLSLMLMDAPSESAGAAAMLEAIGRLARGGMPAVHWVEVLGFDPETEQARRAARHMLRCRTAPGQVVQGQGVRCASAPNTAPGPAFVSSELLLPRRPASCCRETMDWTQLPLRLSWSTSPLALH